MGSKLTSTGVTFGSNTTEQTKPVTEVNGVNPNSTDWNDSGQITVDIGATSDQHDEIDSRVSFLESHDRQTISWGSTQEISTVTDNTGVINDVPQGCVMVGFELAHLYDTNHGSNWWRDTSDVIKKIRYKYIGNI